MDHKVLFDYCSSNMWVVTVPTVDIFSERYTHIGSASNVFSGIFCQILDSSLPLDQCGFTMLQFQLYNSIDSVKYFCKTPNDRSEM